MSMVNNNSFINVQGWMVNDLHLKGNALLIYAIIYGFSQDNKSVYEGSLQYLAEWTNSTKRGVLNALKSLIDDGLIEKQEVYTNKVIKKCKYKVTSVRVIESTKNEDTRKENDQKPTEEKNAVSSNDKTTTLIQGTGSNKDASSKQGHIKEFDFSIFEKQVNKLSENKSLAKRFIEYASLFHERVGINTMSNKKLLECLEMYEDANMDEELQEYHINRICDEFDNDIITLKFSLMPSIIEISNLRKEGGYTNG